MEQPLVSIIMPVYNGEKYLRPCIESILHQTYSNWELLLIDDGSRDHSGAICDEYAKDARIRVVHKKNEGPASARNDGMAMAKGDYISFVDSDDWLEADMFEQMVAAMQSHQAEIIICGYIEEYVNRKKAVNDDGEQKCYEAHEALKKLLEGKIGSYLWSMLFQRDVVQERMFDLKCYEDHATIFKWISHASRVLAWHRAFYHYRQLEGSSIHSHNPEKENNFFLAIKERYHYIAERNLLPGWEKENRRLYLRGCIKLTKDLARILDYNQQRREVIEEVRSELKRFLPISRHELGTKNYIRLRLLLLDVDFYVRILRMSAVFSLGKQRKDRGLFH